ncbi:hypothetical protein ACHAXR_009642 [Thalassiosira sp. AJA248-18]
MMGEEEDMGPPPMPMDEVDIERQVGDFNTNDQHQQKRRRRFVIGGIALIIAVVLSVVLGVTLSSPSQNKNNSSSENNSGGVDVVIIDEEDDKKQQPITITTFQTKDDVITLSPGTNEEEAYISVLENDTTNSIDLVVNAITNQANNGKCVISIDLQQVVFTLNDDDMNFVGSDECTYEACTDVTNEEDRECDTAVVTIIVEEEEEKEGEETATPTEGVNSDMVISSASLQLVPDDKDVIIENDAIVAIHGNTAIVGAANYDNIKGIVLVFVRDDSNDWKQQATLTAPDDDGDVDGGTDCFTSFGWSLGIHGDTIIVGAVGDSDEEREIYNRGSAHVFVRDNSAGTATDADGPIWTHQAKLVAGDGAADDFFGYDVNIFEDTAIVGAVYDDDNGEDSGSVHVFVRDDKDEWNHQTKLLDPKGEAKAYFGNAVGIYDSTIIIGAWWASTAHIFHRDGDGTWTHQVELTDIVDVETDDRFGNRVAIYGDTVVVGARGDDDNNDGKNITDSGSAYVFFRDENNTWMLHSKLVAPDGDVEDQFGNSVSIYNNTIIVGARWDDVDSETDSGSAHVFVKDGDKWAHHSKLIAPKGETEDFFGYSMGIYEGTIVVGSKSGEMHVFSDYLRQLT